MKKVFFVLCMVILMASCSHKVETNGTSCKDSLQIEQVVDTTAVDITVVE
jgi:hypothetical protein